MDSMKEISTHRMVKYVVDEAGLITEAIMESHVDGSDLKQFHESHQLAGDELENKENDCGDVGGKACEYTFASAEIENEEAETMDTSANRKRATSPELIIAKTDFSSCLKRPADDNDKEDGKCDSVEIVGDYKHQSVDAFPERSDVDVDDKLIDDAGPLNLGSPQLASSPEEYQKTMYVQTLEVTEEADLMEQEVDEVEEVDPVPLQQKVQSDCEEIEDDELDFPVIVSVRGAVGPQQSSMEDENWEMEVSGTTAVRLECDAGDKSVEEYGSKKERLFPKKPEQASEDDKKSVESIDLASEEDDVIELEKKEDTEAKATNEMPGKSSSFREATKDQKGANFGLATSRSLYCFNCGGNHKMRNCRYAHDQLEIEKRRKEYFRDNANKQATSGKYEDFRPGIMSGPLRHALGLKRSDLPEHIYRMREIGYPQGWLQQAVVHPPGGEPYICREKLPVYQGFNTPAPYGVNDEGILRGARFSPQDSIENIIKNWQHDTKRKSSLSLRTDLGRTARSSRTVGSHGGDPSDVSWFSDLVDSDVSDKPAYRANPRMGRSRRDQHDRKASQAESKQPELRPRRKRTTSLSLSPPRAPKYRNYRMTEDLEAQKDEWKKDFEKEFLQQYGIPRVSVPAPRPRSRSPSMLDSFRWIPKKDPVAKVPKVEEEEDDDCVILTPESSVFPSPIRSAARDVLKASSGPDAKQKLEKLRKSMSEDEKKLIQSSLKVAERKWGFGLSNINVARLIKKFDEISSKEKKTSSTGTSSTVPEVITLSDSEDESANETPSTSAGKTCGERLLMSNDKTAQSGANVPRESEAMVLISSDDDSRGSGGLEAEPPSCSIPEVGQPEAAESEAVQAGAPEKDSTASKELLNDDKKNDAEGTPQNDINGKIQGDDEESQGSEKIFESEGKEGERNPAENSAEQNNGAEVVEKNSSEKALNDEMCGVAALDPTD